MGITEIEMRDSVRWNAATGFIKTYIIDFKVDGAGPFSVEVDQQGSTEETIRKAIEAKADLIRKTKALK